MSTNKEKFTPGPWMVRHYTAEENYAETYEIQRPNHDYIAGIGHRNMDEQDAANAALIHVAPDMYFKLKEIAEEYRAEEKRWSILAPRYKACGNSMCVNCMEWLGRRIQMEEERIQAEARNEE
jgi:site-specific DNA-cytosine methylase